MKDLFFTYFVDVLNKHYADFKGKASRAQYWYFVLICFLISIIISILTSISNSLNSILMTLFGLALFIPSIAIATRRLHDTDRSGWWQLLALIPIPFIGCIIVIVFLAFPSKSPTRFD